MTQEQDRDTGLPKEVSPVRDRATSTTAATQVDNPNHSAYTDNLIAEGLAIRELGATVIAATDIGSYAVEYATNNWQVFPLRGKVPFASPHPAPCGVFLRWRRYFLLLRRRFGKTLDVLHRVVHPRDGEEPGVVFV